MSDNTEGQRVSVTHDDLVLRAKKWLAGRCGVVLTEYVCDTREVPDAIGFSSRRSILVECKATRADFLADRRKTHRNGLRRMGNYRFYLVPPRLVSVEEVPDGWGLLYAHPRNVSTPLRAPYRGEPEIKAVEYHLLYSLARRAELRGLLPVLTAPEDWPASV